MYQDAETMLKEQEKGKKWEGKEYEYRGETYYISRSGERELSVSDGENTATVQVDILENEFYVWWVPGVVGGNSKTIEEAVDHICFHLDKIRSRLTSSDRYKEMDEFMESLK